MSPKNKKDGFRELVRIEDIIGKFVISDNETLTPNRLMECLKGESEEPHLSHLGKLLKKCADSDDDFDIIRWVVFHFDLPTSTLGWDETSTRNWIALRIRDQSFIDELHRESVGKGAEFMKYIYAPSVVSSKFKEFGAEQYKRLREKWWLYSFDLSTKSERITQHRKCTKSVDKDDLNILCFSCDVGNVVNILTCAKEMDDNVCSLGSLLKEPEPEVADRYLRFAKYYTSTEQKNSNGAMLDNSCNFYARIPVFFHKEPARYMTEIFIALNDKTKNIRNIVRILQKIVPALRICVTFINSHIAYAIAHQIRIQKEIHALLQEQGHTIINNLPHDQLDVALSAVNDSERNQSIQDALIATETLEQAVLIALGRGVTENFPRSILGILKWLADHQQSLKAKGILTIESGCKDKSLDTVSVDSAFTLLWNLWDNAEKNSRKNNIMTFNVTVRSVDNYTNIEINLVNKGNLSDERQKFLLGINPKLPNTKRFTSGLEVIKRSIDILRWQIREITVLDNKTSIKIIIPIRN